MSKHLIFRGSCEEEYYPYFVNIITNFGITPQVFSSNVPIANARRSLSMHAVLDFFVFNFDLEYIFIFAFLISKVRHHDGCGQVAASGEEGGNKSQPPSGETGRVHLQFANISLQKHLDGKPKITLGFFLQAKLLVEPINSSHIERKLLDTYPGVSKVLDDSQDENPLDRCF